MQYLNPKKTTTHLFWWSRLNENCLEWESPGWTNRCDPKFCTPFSMSAEEEARIVARDGWQQGAWDL